MPWVKGLKRSRAKVSPQTLKDFFVQLGSNVEGVKPEHFFNHDELYLKDDPGAEACFFEVNSKYC